MGSPVSLRQTCVKSLAPPSDHDGRGKHAAEDESWDHTQAIELLTMHG
jgi:hypothetical protein